jgi:hypothetical protein
LAYKGTIDAIGTTPEMIEHLEILRRIAERGLKLAQQDLFDGDTRYLDLFQHMLDEIEGAKRTLVDSTT